MLVVMKTTINKIPSVHNHGFTFVIAPIYLKENIIRLSKEHKTAINCFEWTKDELITVYFRDEDDHKMEDIFKLIETYNAIHSV